jgi:hypothetical protein
MNDHDLDARLRDHGATWRADNHGRPGVDWTAATASHRSKLTSFAVAGVAVAVAAAVVVPLTLTAGSATHTRPQPANRPGAAPGSKSEPASARAGAPKAFVAISGKSVVVVGGPDGGSGFRPSSSYAVADATSPNTSVAYGAFPLGGCRTSVQQETVSTVSDVATLAGGQPVPASQGASMAVSPDGTKLALEVSTRSHGSHPCNGPEQLVVVNLRTHAVRRWNGHPQVSFIGNLQWAPDSRHLAYLASACCGGGADGTRVMDTTAPGTSYVTQPVVLPAVTGTGRAYGPVFWWHGRLSTIVSGILRVLNGHGGVGSVEASGFPADQIDSVSSDPTGGHLLLGNLGGATYRWDNGSLSLVPGRWVQPAW